MLVLRRLGKFVPVVTALSAVLVTPSAVNAGDVRAECDAIPYIDEGDSTSVGGTSVTATVNTANQGPGPDYYLHQPAEMSWTGSDALDTTLTFAPGITELVARTSFHDDGWSGSGGQENYRFVAKNSGGGFVEIFDIRDVDGRFEYSFDEPVTTLEITYSPRRGVYGSFLRMSLPSERNACDPVAALPTSVTVLFPSGAIVFGDDLPELVPNAVESDDLTTPVALDGTPDCLLNYPVDISQMGPWFPLTSTTPVGTYLVQCTGISVTSPYEIVEYEFGEFRIVETEADLVRPSPTFEFDYRLPEVQTETGLPSTR
jgi:hypothetical protein